MRLGRKLLLLSPIALIVLVCVGPGLAEDPPRGADLLVIVRDTHGRPLAACDVLLSADGLHVQSDEHGRARFSGLALGSRVHVSVAGASPREVVLHDGEESRVEIIVGAGTTTESGAGNR